MQRMNYSVRAAIQKSRTVRKYPLWACKVNKILNRCVKWPRCVNWQSPILSPNLSWAWVLRFVYNILCGPLQWTYTTNLQVQCAFYWTNSSPSSLGVKSWAWSAQGFNEIKGVRKEKVRTKSQTSLPQVLPTWRKHGLCRVSNRQKDHCNLQTNRCHFRQYHQSFPGHYQSSFSLAAARLMARVQRIDRTLRTGQASQPVLPFRGQAHYDV